MFSSEVELDKFLGSIGVIPDAYRAISKTTLPYELHSTDPSGINVLAFNSCSPDYTTRFLNGEFDLVSSENLQVVDFISTKVNPKFSINRALGDLYQQLDNDLRAQLTELENKHINSSLIITGSGLGGYLAILSTLRLHHAIDVEESKGSKKTKRPICITFGSPLVGDAALQQAIAQRPRWKSSLLNVVANMDAVATFLSSNTLYKPLGTFMFCTESGSHTAFEDQDMILSVLNVLKLSNPGNLQKDDYTTILSSLKRKVLYRGVPELGNMNFNSNLFEAGITLQLREVGVLDDMTHQIEKMEEQIKLNKIKKNAYDPTKKLIDSKISLTYMEWYMKTRRSKGGYYDSYKNDETIHEIKGKNVIVKHQRYLNQYWEKFIEDKDRMPQKEGTKLRKRWLYSGNNYRRIVEPLDIARYYKEHKVNYIDNRPDYYKLLERWAEEDKKELEVSDLKRNTAASLTEDSCFWAHVEEALISLKDVGVNNAEKLEEFEAYVMKAINEYSVSPDIFLEGSSFMKWWDMYKAHKGNGYASAFALYMNNKNYESYQ